MILKMIGSLTGFGKLVIVGILSAIVFGFFWRVI